MRWKFLLVLSGSNAGGLLWLPLGFDRHCLCIRLYFKESTAKLYSMRHERDSGLEGL